MNDWTAFMVRRGVPLYWPTARRGWPGFEGTNTRHGLYNLRGLALHEGTTLAGVPQLGQRVVLEFQLWRSGIALGKLRRLTRILTRKH